MKKAQLKQILAYAIDPMNSNAYGRIIRSLKPNSIDDSSISVRTLITTISELSEDWESEIDDYLA